MPPIGEGDSDGAMNEAFELMDAYNASAGVPGNSRIEYASDELLGRFTAGKLEVHPMGTDYVYDTRRMIDLAGGDLASKRQAKNRFLRNHAHRVETYDAALHFDECLTLLRSWTTHQDIHHSTDAAIGTIKRHKESLACELSLRYAADLGLRGMVVYVDEPTGASAIRGFTFGECLGSEQSSIVIEKTDLELKGMAQFIFSDFCERFWSDRPLVNVGDDWGLQTLAWTKMSYRPVKLLQKYSLRRAAAVKVAFPPNTAPQVDALATELAFPETQVRPARKQDVAAAVMLEQACFTAFSLTKRQLQYLQQRPSAVFLVAQQGERVVGEGIALVRQHNRANGRQGTESAPSGRIYSLAVSDQCRSQKIGSRLLQAMLDGLTQRGVQRVYLEVEEHNTPAIRLYQQAGFHPIGSLPDYYGPGKNALHMMWQTPTPQHQPTLTELAA